MMMNNSFDVTWADPMIPLEVILKIMYLLIESGRFEYSSQILLIIYNTCCKVQTP